MQVHFSFCKHAILLLFCWSWCTYVPTDNDGVTPPNEENSNFPYKKIHEQNWRRLVKWNWCCFCSPSLPHPFSPRWGSIFHIHSFRTFSLFFLLLCIIIAIIFLFSRKIFLCVPLHWQCHSKQSPKFSGFSTIYLTSTGEEMFSFIFKSSVQWYTGVIFFTLFISLHKMVKFLFLLTFYTILPFESDFKMRITTSCRVYTSVAKWIDHNFVFCLWCCMLY